MKKNIKNYIRDLIKAKPKSLDDLAKIKRRLAKRYKTGIISNITILKHYRQFVKKVDNNLVRILRKREIRTLSGVAIVAVLTKPYPCPGRCAYCPSETDMPKSYLSNEPAVMRAILCQFDPYKQVKTRLQALEMEGHSSDKIELIVMGGTWSYLPRDYQVWFINQCFRACNVSLRSKQKTKNKKLKTNIKNLKILHKFNETAKHRIIGLTLETRPDYINAEEIKWMRQLGCTRVELGVQAIDDKILALNNRGHGVAEIVEATKMLKSAGFKVMYHMMPNLPGSSPKKDLSMFKKLFSDQRFQPDMLKIYPTVLTKGTLLAKWYKQKKWIPYSGRTLERVLLGMKKIVPKYVRITRLIRDIPSESIIAGNKVSNLRQLLHEKMKKEGIKCKCIRCREARKEPLDNKNVKYYQHKYSASDGMEYFLTYEDKKKDLLYAFLRLRVPSITRLHPSQAQRPELGLSVLQNASIIRELHTYGELVPIAKREKKAVQHFGLGRQLIKKAESLSKKLDFQKIAVISGIGVREYYRKLGYKLRDTYIVKDLTK